jgi:drug/metabolite transporter (DMT)-like permease
VTPTAAGAGDAGGPLGPDGVERAAPGPGTGTTSLPDRLRSLQSVGLLSGFAAGAWLGAAEAPTKLVDIGIAPVVISLVMVVGVFLARWSLPALLQGTARLGEDVRRAPHLLVWAVLAGCLWAVANTLTVFAIRDIGLSIAFPLWNTNSLLGILWGYVFFNELRGAGRRRLAGVLGGALVMFAGATLLALATSAGAAPRDAVRGMVAALTAGALWGTMYIPYRKAYLSGMSPLSFIAFFTVGELTTMAILATMLSGGVTALGHELAGARGVLFWILLGGFVWVVGDLFQQYAAKYVGIGRGIPLSNTNQLWGLFWGILVFGELRGAGAGVLAGVVGGSLLMAAGAGAIAFSSPGTGELGRWRDAALREARRYGLNAHRVEASLSGRVEAGRRRRGPLDIALVLVATAVFVGLAVVARTPHLALHGAWLVLVLAATLLMLVAAGVALWRATHFE